MSGDNNIDRRRLLKSIAASGALAKWPALAGAAPLVSCRVFTPSQAALMEALVDQLIPADDFPGARDAGVVSGIDEKLAGGFGSFFAAAYQAGLQQIDQVSRQLYDREFTFLDGHQQSELLHAIADNSHGARIHDFFWMVVDHTFEGYYGNPRDGASWKMIGFGG